VIDPAQPGPRHASDPHPHHIEDSEVAAGPTFTDAHDELLPWFAEIVPYLLSQLGGAVVVAHDTPFDEAFLAAELDRTGYPLNSCRALLLPCLGC
jgi:DNA polymerase III epsilon subunit-like protein